MKSIVSVCLNEYAAPRLDWYELYDPWFEDIMEVESSGDLANIGFRTYLPRLIERQALESTRFIVQFSPFDRANAASLVSIDPSTRVDVETHIDSLGESGSVRARGENSPALVGFLANGLWDSSNRFRAFTLQLESEDGPSLFLTHHGAEIGLCVRRMSDLADVRAFLPEEVRIFREYDLPRLTAKFLSQELGDDQTQVFSSHLHKFYFRGEAIEELRGSLLPVDVLVATHSTGVQCQDPADLGMSVSLAVLLRDSRVGFDHFANLRAVKGIGAPAILMLDTNRIAESRIMFRTEEGRYDVRELEAQIAKSPVTGASFSMSQLHTLTTAIDSAIGARRK